MWKKPWPNKEGTAICGALFLTGVLLQISVGKIDWELVAFPANLLLLGTFQELAGLGMDLPKHQSPDSVRKMVNAADHLLLRSQAQQPSHRFSFSRPANDIQAYDFGSVESFFGILQNRGPVGRGILIQ